jgi:hypothetical protein
MRNTRNVLLASCVLALAGACASNPDSSGTPTNPFSFPAPNGGDGGLGVLKRQVPTDTRAPLTAENPPVPITGGTLIVTNDGKFAVAADPDRDRVSVVDIHTLSLVRTIALSPGDEPGRLAQDDKGLVHVALRRGGVVADIDIVAGQVLARRTACAAPRGIAFEPGSRMLRVACANGELVSLPADGGDAVERLMVDSDLRDVLVTQDGLRISRFKHAELLTLPTGATAVASRTRPIQRNSTFPEAETGALVVDTLEPEVAWRTISDLKGGAFMLHQGARKGEIPLPKPDDSDSETSGEAGSGVTGVGGGGAFTGLGGSAYGGDGSCQGVVQAELTHIDASGVPSDSMRFDAVLAVDMAVAPMSGIIAVAQAGQIDPDQPLPTFVQENADGSSSGAIMGPSGGPFGSVMAFEQQSMEDAANQPCGFAKNVAPVQGQPTALAFAPDDTLIVQSREPAQLSVLRNFSNSGADQGPLVIDLGGASVYDTGHELFHRNAGAGIACASCHAEGGDDGHTWHFAEVGPRRTQSVNVGLEGTQPFHWSGDQPNVAALMEDVFVQRMGGVHESAARTHSLEGWLFELTPLPAQRAANDRAAMRGKALFEGDAQCSTCHNGAKLTDNKTVDVGTGEPLQVPSLRGVGYRAPLIHNGCAATLKERFDPSCGGDKHGKTADLSNAQISDLIAYLQTL